MSRRASLAFAVVLAALATVALFGYVRGLERQALGKGESVEVLVAKDTIPAGTSADAAMRRGLMGRATLPKKAIIDGSIVSLESIAGKVAGVEILRGEQIVGARFVSPERAKSSFAIPADRQAMAVEVSGPPGVAGYVQQGNHVSIIAKAAAGDEARVQYLVQDVEVLAVGQRVVKESKGTGSNAVTTQTGKVLLTLSLSASEAEKVAYAVMQGEIYFTLLPAGQRTQTTSGRVAANLFS